MVKMPLCQYLLRSVDGIKRKLSPAFIKNLKKNNDPFIKVHVAKFKNTNIKSEIRNKLQ
jgi:hypothetical protein